MGYQLIQLHAAPPELPVDLDSSVQATARAVTPYTLTSVERIAALVHAVRHLVRHDIPGAFVECGVWRGGSMLAVTRTLVEEGITDRELYLYDTFTRMPPPGDRDWDVWGRHASGYFAGPVDPTTPTATRRVPPRHRASLEPYFVMLASVAVVGVVDRLGWWSAECWRPCR